MTNLPELTALEREYEKHQDAEIKNIERLQTIQHGHTPAMCKAVEALIKAFKEHKIYIIIEAEISSLGKRSRPEDFIAWIENVGIFVIEVKSHTIHGIRSFENNVPQVIYKGNTQADCDLLEQPKNFAYDLKGQLERVFDEKNQKCPPLYYAGWLPNVSPEDIASRSAIVAPDKVWLSDMLEKDVFKKRLSSLKNITYGIDTNRETLELFCKLFGTTSGLKQIESSKSFIVGSLGHLIDRKNRALKRLTIEQETLAFSPNLVRGPKVIRGVAGSGKTIVLANAVAEVFLGAKSDIANSNILPNLSDSNSIPKILVLCYNRALVSYLKNLIISCFNSRKPNSEWNFPSSSLKVINIDRYAYSLAGSDGYSFDNIQKTVDYIIDNHKCQEEYKYIFIDEGQDIDPTWYSLISRMAITDQELGKNIIVFYDDAQNIYGVKRPGIGGTPPWKELLGSIPNPRGLKTIMRVGHRNPNQVLSFSFNLLLGSLAEEDPKMVEFSGMSEFEKEIIPHDVAIDHPRAGMPCVERIDSRQFKVNFSVHNAEPPNVHIFVHEDEMLTALVNDIKKTIDQKQGNVEPSNILVMVPYLEQIITINERLNAKNIETHNPVKFPPNLGGRDGRDQPAFQQNKVTVSTVKSVKGYTAHICHLVYVHSFEKENMTKKEIQEMRSQIHVACTRSSLCLDLWGRTSSLMQEARKIRELIE